MASARSGKQRLRRDVRVANLDEPGVVAPATVRRWVNAVLDGEGVGAAALSITFLTPAKMRGLNFRTRRRNRATDVLAFPLTHLGVVAGDIYICPAVATRSAVEQGVPLREELLRLVVHGTLHVLGHDHPEGTARSDAPMWRAQERYVRQISPRSVH